MKVSLQDPAAKQCNELRSITENVCAGKGESEPLRGVFRAPFNNKLKNSNSSQKIEEITITRRLSAPINEPKKTDLT